MRGRERERERDRDIDIIQNYNTETTCLQIVDTIPR